MRGSQDCENRKRGANMSPKPTDASRDTPALSERLAPAIRVKISLICSWLRPIKSWSTSKIFQLVFVLHAEAQRKQD